MLAWRTFCHKASTSKIVPMQRAVATEERANHVVRRHDSGKSSQPSQRLRRNCFVLPIFSSINSGELSGMRTIRRIAALVGVAATGLAHAQSSVTLYGVIDVGPTYVSNEGGAH